MKTEELNRMFVWLLKTNAIIRQGKDTENGPNFIKDQVFSSFKTQIHAFRFVTCIHGVTLPFHNSPKVIYWIEIWCLCRPFEYHEVIVMFKKPLWDDLSFDTWFQYPAEAAIRWWYIVVIKGQTWPWCLKEPLLWCPNTTSSLSDTHTHTHTIWKHWTPRLFYLICFTELCESIFSKTQLKPKIHTAHQQYSICKTTAITKKPQNKTHILLWASHCLSMKQWVIDTITDVLVNKSINTMSWLTNRLVPC